MELKDYNLKVVTVNERGCALQPISTCTINNKKYTCNTDETEEEKIFIPIEDLKFGCYMSIKPLKKPILLRYGNFSGDGTSKYGIFLIKKMIPIQN